jgi:hypothetical protein
MRLSSLLSLSALSILIFLFSPLFRTQSFCWSSVHPAAMRRLLISALLLACSLLAAGQSTVVIGLGGRQCNALGSRNLGESLQEHWRSTEL